MPGKKAPYNTGRKTVSKLEHPDINLCALLDQATDIINRATELEIEPHRVTLAQARVLFLLARAKGSRGVTLTDLSKWMLREPNSVSVLISRMEKAGLLKKMRDAAENRIFVSITPKGREMVMDRLTEKSMVLIMSALTEGEKQNLRKYLKKLRVKGRGVLGIDLKPPFV
ncbi:MAG TPA: MarR family winged helix-turn-helix transcriptional regulator [Dehalococcoidia bacterium]|nr:MarR family winged helix-turn-helix transcriptional regulator [Dehalococcoidia bacterium]